MKKILTVALTGALVLSPVTAFADTYKDKLSAWKTATKSYHDSRSAANSAFKEAIKKANDDFKAARLSAKTVEEKNALIASRKAAVASAAAAHDAAIAALGAKPIRPEKPVRPTPTPSASAAA